MHRLVRPLSFLATFAILATPLASSAGTTKASEGAPKPCLAGVCIGMSADEILTAAERSGTLKISPNLQRLVAQTPVCDETPFTFEKFTFASDDWELVKVGIRPIATDHGVSIVVVNVTATSKNDDVSMTEALKFLDGWSAKYGFPKAKRDSFLPSTEKGGIEITASTTSGFGNSKQRLYAGMNKFVGRDNNDKLRAQPGCKHAPLPRY